nr:hypothetical protein [Tanacetum cinerariifolium]
MLTKPQVFYDDTHKQALGYRNPFYLKKPQRMKPTLYDGNMISKKHDVISVVDEEETLILEEENAMNIMTHVDSVPVNVLLPIINVLRMDYIDQYSENLVLKAELAKKEQMVEKKIFDEVLRCSRLENRNVNLELKLQHQKESFLNNRSLNNQNAPEILEIFKINKWQAKLDAKDVSFANLRKHIESLKEKKVVEKDATSNKTKVIAPRMFKLDLEPLSPKVLKNRDAYVNYIKHIQENANIIRELVEHARALKPLDNDLDFALVPNSSSPTLYVPPTKKDWDILFQPIFDEYFNPPPSVASPVPVYQKLVNKVDELRAFSCHMLGAYGVQIPENNLDNLKLTSEEDGEFKIVDP